MKGPGFVRVLRGIWHARKSTLPVWLAWGLEPKLVMITTGTRPAKKESWLRALKVEMESPPTLIPKSRPLTCGPRLDVAGHERSLHLGDCVVDRHAGTFVQDFHAEDLHRRSGAISLVPARVISKGRI